MDNQEAYLDNAKLPRLTPPEQIHSLEYVEERGKRIDD